MNALSSKAILYLAAACLAGCASTSKPLSETASSFKKIGVVSVAANDFSRRHVGVTVFGNEFEKKDISGWGVNKAYEAQLATAVEKVFGALAVQAPYAAAEFSRLNESGWEAIESVAKAYCASAGVDAIVVAAPRKTGDIYAKTNQRLEGVGIYTRLSHGHLHVLAVVGLLDCRTGKPVATANLARRSIESQNGFPIIASDIPTTAIPKMIGRAKMSDWTQGDEQSVRRIVIELPERFWAEAMKEMLSPISLPTSQPMSRGTSRSPQER